MRKTERATRLIGVAMSATVAAFAAYILTFNILATVRFAVPRAAPVCHTLTIVGAAAEARKDSLPLIRMSAAQRAALVAHKGNPPQASDGKFELYHLAGGDLGILMIFKNQCLVNSIGPIPEAIIDELTH